MISLTALGFFLPSILIGAISSIFLKKASKKIGNNLKSVVLNRDLVIGFLLAALSLFIYLFSLKYAELSKLAPLVSINYILIAIFSSLFLRERITKQKIIGIIFITLGSFFIIR